MSLEGFARTSASEATVPDAHGGSESLTFVDGARPKVPSRYLDQPEVRGEKAVDLKRRREGHLGDVTTRMRRARELMEKGVKEEELSANVSRLETAFHKFVDAHEAYLEFEDDERERNLAKDSYEKEMEIKFLFDVEVKSWKSRQTPAKSDGKSSRSSKTRRSSASSRSVVREKKRLLEETRLTVEALEEEQTLERLKEREEAEFRRKELEIEEEKLQRNAEWSRKREMLRVELEMKKAAAGLIIEQEELESDLGDDRSEDFESKPRTLQPKADLNDSHQYSPQGSGNSGGPKLQSQSPSANQQGVPSQTTPANQPLDSQQSYQPNQSPLEQTMLYTIQELIKRQPISSPQHQVSPHVDTTQWTAIADAIRQGPSLPKIELIKFGGGPSEYAEFIANFRDHIESQVTDDSQRLTRLLAQCVGKAKEAIRSCVNLPVGQRYREAWATLSKNFGQSHMVADAHMKRLREINMRRGDAPSLMDFARKLEDAKRVLTSMGPRYASRLDNEDTILMLMKKLPDEGLKRKWTDIAGDLIQSKGQVDFVEFLNFIQKRADRLNNRFGQELKSPLAQNERERRYPTRERQEQPPFRATTMATQRSANNNAGSVPWKCPQCSGAHAIWRCEIFKGASYQDRLCIMRQKRLCGSCLGGGHFSRSCRKGFTCKEPGCGRRHNTLLHPPDSETTRPPKAPQRETEAREPAVESRARSTSGRATARDRTTTTLISSSSTCTSATSRETGLVDSECVSRSSQ